MVFVLGLDFIERGFGIFFFRVVVFMIVGGVSLFGIK